MLKGVKKEDAQKLFAKMAAISDDKDLDESEDDGSIAKAIAAAPSKKNELKLKRK